jgi:Xaa-Pro dipeptidase
MSSTPSADRGLLFAEHLRILEQRAARALEEAGGYRALLLYSGSAPGIFRDDQSYPFRVHPTFKAWAPLTDAPQCFVHVEPGAKPLLALHSPADYWHKPAQIPEGYWTRHFDIRAVPDLTAARAALPEDLSGTVFIGEPFAELRAWGIGAVNHEPLLRRLEFERAAKTPYELECLREANRLGARGHLAAARAFAAGASEFEIHLEYLRACGLREQELPYNAIIALNEGAAVLHYQVLERRPPIERHSMLIDAGAEFSGYASDITRTYSYRDSEFAALIGKMDEMQQSLCASVRAGVDWRDVHLSAHRLAAEVLHEAGVIRCDADEAVDRGISSVFLPHGIGHLLGLQVHDVGGFAASPDGEEIPRPPGHPYLRLTRVLEPGFVVTMEPGVYFIEQLLAEARADKRAEHIDWQRVDTFRKFGGIRVEDDLAVTDTGAENLTRDAFRAVADGLGQA